MKAGQLSGISTASGESCAVSRVEFTAERSVVSSSLLLRDHTTLRVGGPARRLVVTDSEAELIDVVRTCDAAGEPLLVLAGGSNLVVSDEGFPGTVVRVATRGISADESPCGGASVTVAAGEPWDDVVATAVERGWVGLEALSGIPGLAGSTPIQNVGAYGAEVAQTIASVRTFDRATAQLATFPLVECGFGYRTSRFKAQPGRYVVLDVTFAFPLGTLGAPLRYGELAARLGVEVGERVPAVSVRAAVLEIRRSKAMVIDASDHDTWSAGSFFTNPIVDAAALPHDAPRFATEGDLVKTSAAWLIEQAGFSRGYGTSLAQLSSKHVLVLTNRGEARASDIVALAREVRDGVRARFGVTLVPEPVFVGISLETP